LGNPAVVTELLSQGMQVNVAIPDPLATTAEKGTPLDFAIEGGNTEVVDLLIRSGLVLDAVQISSAGKHVASGLGKSAAKGRVKFLERLVALGIPIDQADPDGISPLLSAIRLQDHELLLRLTENGVPATADSDLSPLNLAAEKGDLQAVDILLNKGASLGMTGARALTNAITRGATRTALELIARGAPIDQLPRESITPMHAAALVGNETVFEALLAKGARLDTDIPGFGTPLTVAISQGRISIARQLLDHGALATQQSSTEGTPILAAAKLHNPDLIETLLAHGANSDAVVRKNVPPGDGSGWQESTPMHELLSSYVSGDPTSQQSLEILLKAGANINRTLKTSLRKGDGTGLEAAFPGWASDAGKFDVSTIERLLKAGLKVNATFWFKVRQGKAHATLSGPAVWYGGRFDEDSLVLLVRHGFKLNAVNAMHSVGNIPSMATDLFREIGGGNALHIILSKTLREGDDRLDLACAAVRLGANPSMRNMAGLRATDLLDPEDSVSREKFKQCVWEMKTRRRSS
jgi:ankyrin repeat protein